MLQNPQALLLTAHVYLRRYHTLWSHGLSFSRDSSSSATAATRIKRSVLVTGTQVDTPTPPPPEVPDQPPRDPAPERFDPADVAYFKRGEVENPEFWWRLVDAPSFAGKHVLDVGCGLGALCVDMAAKGAARVVGLDTETKLITFARRYTAATFPELQPVLEFSDEDLAQFDQGKFDIIVSKDSFEHIMDLEGMIREMASHLKPGGRIYAGFGPLYNSPLGHHGLIATWLPWRQFPWAHLWESEDKIVARLNRIRERGGRVFTYKNEPLTSIRDLGLSMYSLADYRRFIYGSGLKVVRFEVNRSTRPFSRALAVLRRLPFMEEYCTNNIYCVLEKPFSTHGD
jgi:2-polyprenyl-3-methyl-5-hydroxy-6-metoxy-1,4-benzoquinol methylase